MSERGAHGRRTRGARMLSAGERGLVVELGDEVDDALNARVHALARAVAARLGAEVLELVPTYRSLLVVHDPLRVSRARLAARIAELLEGLPVDASPGAARLVRIPACYGGPFGPDLDAVAELHGLGARELVDLHAGPGYLVHMLGFTPGFPYLGGMPRRLATPRLDAPRARVAAGSVGVAGEQTGIYPVESPGGWRILARTPLRLFDPRAQDPFLLAPGDRVRFEPIGPEEFDAIARAVAAGTYAPRIARWPEGGA